MQDEYLRVPGSRIDENLSRLETKWQQERGAKAPHSGIQVGRVRGNPNHPSGTSAARFVDTFEQLTGKQIVWVDTTPVTLLPPLALERITRAELKFCFRPAKDEVEVVQ